MKSFHFLNGLLAWLQPSLTFIPFVQSPVCRITLWAHFVVTGCIFGTFGYSHVLGTAGKPIFTPKGHHDILSVASMKWQVSPQSTLHGPYKDSARQTPLTMWRWEHTHTESPNALLTATTSQSGTAQTDCTIYSNTRALEGKMMLGSFQASKSYMQ